MREKITQTSNVCLPPSVLLSRSKSPNQPELPVRLFSFCRYGSLTPGPLSSQMAPQNVSTQGTTQYCRYQFIHKNHFLFGADFGVVPGVIYSFHAVTSATIFFFLSPKLFLVIVFQGTSGVSSCYMPNQSNNRFRARASSILYPPGWWP